MKREEIDAFIASYEKIAMTQPAWTDLVIRVPAESLQNLLRLARLGASVAAPRDDEIERVAWELLKAQLDQPDEHDYFTWDDVFPEPQIRFKSYARAALTALSNQEEQQ